MKCSENVRKQSKIPQKFTDPLGLAGKSVEYEPRDPNQPPPEKVYISSMYILEIGQ